MTKTPVSLPYDRGTMTFSLPEGWLVDYARVPPPSEGPGLEDLVRGALAQPVEGPRLRELARPGNAGDHRHYRRHPPVSGCGSSPSSSRGAPRGGV